MLRPMSLPMAMVIRRAGFTWSTLEDDLVGADRDRQKADAAYAQAVRNKARPITVARAAPV